MDRPFPGCARGAVCQMDAHRLQFFAEGIGLVKILCSAGVVARFDKACHLRIGLFALEVDNIQYAIRLAHEVEDLTRPGRRPVLRCSAAG